MSYRDENSRMGGEINVVLQQQRMVNWDLSLASHNMCASSLFLWGGRRSVLPFKRHTRHGCVFLEEVCRTIDNSSVLVVKMLVVCIETHV